MEVTSLGAMRQYNITKQAFSVDKNINAAKPSSLENSGESVISGAAAQFSEVFESIEGATQAMVQGTGDAHSVVEALASAEIALETAVTIRNRVVEAYQELLRMPV